MQEDLSQELYHSGGDQQIDSPNGDLVIRVLGWNGIVFVEAIGSRDDMLWEVESVNGKARPSWVEQYGDNLLALNLASTGNPTEVILVGSNNIGDEIRVAIKLDLLNVELGKISPLGDQQAQNFGAQIQSLLNKPVNEARSLLLKTT